MMPFGNLLCYGTRGTWINASHDVQRYTGMDLTSYFKDGNTMVKMTSEALRGRFKPGSPSERIWQEELACARVLRGATITVPANVNVFNNGNQNSILWRCVSGRAKDHCRTYACCRLTELVPPIGQSIFSALRRALGSTWVRSRADGTTLWLEHPSITT